jgi:hypothetical protein
MISWSCYGCELPLEDVLAFEPVEGESALDGVLGELDSLLLDADSPAVLDDESEPLAVFLPL